MKDGKSENDSVRDIEINSPVLSRRQMLKGAGAMGLVASANLWIPAPARARWKPACPENLRRFNGVSPAHIKVAENYSSPNLMGPPMSDELIDVITHLYSAEEAQIVQYMTPWSSKTAGKLARQAKRPVSEVRTILDNIISFQNSLLTFGKDKSKRYNIFTLLPGTFEFILVKPDESHYTEWHEEFCHRFSKLYNSGAFADINEKPTELVRYIPPYPTIKNNPVALPSDKLPAILDRYDDIAVGLCQCTTMAKFTDASCGRPHYTCMSMGRMARYTINRGHMNRIDKQGALEIKAAAEEEGLSTWMMNLDDEYFKFNLSCSCCGCCCLALRSLNEFNKPGLLTKPHFMPKIDHEKCDNSGVCVMRCNTGAHSVSGDNHTHDPSRCIGCGLCVTTCHNDALTMQPVNDYEPPFKNASQLLAKKGPTFVSNIRSEKNKRK